MHLRHGWLWFCLLSLLFSSSVVGCSSGGNSESSASGSPPPTTPASASLIWSKQNVLFRSQTDGSGIVTLADNPGLDPFGTMVSGSTLVYHVTAPPIPPLTFGLNDLWQVQTSGTGRQVIVATADAENLRDVFVPWIIYDRSVHTQGTVSSSTIRSARLDGPGQALLGTSALYRLHVGERTVIEQVVNNGGGGSFSVLADGTDVRPLIDIPSRPGGDTFRTAAAAIGNTVLFDEFFFPENISNILAVPITGEAVVPLTQGSDFQAFRLVVGQRIVYQRCKLVPIPGDRIPMVGPCDVYSVLSDGSGNVPLGIHADSEFTQGAIGDHVIIRRNDVAGDALYSIPAGGGTETPLIKLGQNEFVTVLVGDRMVLIRSNGLWSMKADGSGLVQLTDDTSDRPTGSTGPFVCFQRGSSQPDLWCVPADGSGGATQVAAGALFIGGL